MQANIPYMDPMGHVCQWDTYPKNNDNDPSPETSPGNLECRSHAKKPTLVKYQVSDETLEVVATILKMVKLLLEDDTLQGINISPW